SRRFVLNGVATADFYTRPLHDALPICGKNRREGLEARLKPTRRMVPRRITGPAPARVPSPNSIPAPIPPLNPGTVPVRTLLRTQTRMRVLVLARRRVPARIRLLNRKRA